MQAFHNDAELKSVTIERLRQHMEAGELVPQHRFWEGGKGSPAGCSVHDADPLVYESKLGIARMVLPLMEHLYSFSQLLLKPQEGNWLLPRARNLLGWVQPEQLLASKRFPIDWLEAIPVGADLSGVCTQFVLWLFTDACHGVLSMTTNTRVRELVGKVVEAHRGTAAGAQLPDKHWAALRSHALALREAWAQMSVSAEARAAEVAGTASWPQKQGGGRVAEETLSGWWRVAEGQAAAASGWTDADQQEIHRAADGLRSALEAIPVGADKATIAVARDAAFAASKHHMQTELADLSARGAAYTEETAKRQWSLIGAGEQALLRILRAAPVPA